MRREHTLRLLLAITVAACGKSDKAPPATGSGSSAVVPAEASRDAAAATPVDAAAPADAATPATALPVEARCSGRWTLKPHFDECNAKLSAPFGEIEATIAASPQGWTATIAKPSGMTAKHVSVSWDATERSCRASIEVSGGPSRFELELRRGGIAAGTEVRLQFVTGECISYGRDDKPTFVPDAGELPPIDPAIAGVAGTYDVAIAWPAIKCVMTPAAKQRFTITVDRVHGDVLEASGTAWPVDEVRYNGKSNLYLRTSNPVPDDPDHPVQQRLVLDIKGSEVTGKAQFIQEVTGMDDDAKLCPVANDAKVTGTVTSGGK
jgi:hypothetical protein